MPILLLREPCGSSIEVSPDRRSATRRNSRQEFNNGIVLTSQALEDNQLLSVTIDALVPTWTGSILFGVTATDPRGLLTLPSSAANLKACTWLYTGSCILYNGKQIIENYGRANLDTLTKGDRVGVVRRSNGSLHFVVNGVDQGPAACDTPSRLFAVLDLYGKCVQISVNETVPIDAINLLSAPSPNLLPPPLIASSSSPSSSLAEQVVPCFGLFGGGLTTPPVAYQTPTNDSAAMRTASFKRRSGSSSVSNDLGPDAQTARGNTARSSPTSAGSGGDQETPEGPLRFHERCGSNVRLAPDLMSAERVHAIDHFNNGVLMSHRPLRDGEVFEIRIDALVTKWIGSLEVGVTSHSPDQLDFPETMTSMRSGTIIMNGLGIMTNGVRTKNVYASTNLDHLRVGDTVGVSWRVGGHVHFLINGEDQGVAADGVPEGVFAVVDLYGRASRVTIVTQPQQQQQQQQQQNLQQRQQDETQQVQQQQAADEDQEVEETEEWNNTERECWSQRALCFAATDSVAFSTDLRTATFVSSGNVQSATLLSERQLRIGEAFCLRLSAFPLGAHVSLGVAMRTPCTPEGSSVSHENGLWFFPSRGLTIDGQLVDANYGRDIATQLKKGDRVGVFVSRETAVHFFVNERDLGVALQAAPLPLWGVGAMLLGGPAPQTCVVSLVQPERPLLEDPKPEALRFHTSRHGSKALVLNSGLTAVRIDPHKDFNFAMVTSNRPLTDNEIFEVVVEEMEGRWTGSLEVGVTAIPPEQLNFPSTLVNVCPDIWMLSGAAVMCAGATVSVDYPCNLDLVRVGSRVGVQRRDDGTLHYYIDGHDLGPACSGMPARLWAVIDMYGQCARVSVVYATEHSDSAQGATQELAAPSGAALAGGHQQSAAPESANDGAGLTAHNGNGAGGCSSSNNSNSTSHQFNTGLGHNAVLRNDARSACRTSGFDNGLLFSCGPLDLEELFEVQIEQVHSNMLTGNVIVGLTTFTPQPGESVRYRSFRELLDDSKHVSCLVVGRRVYSNCVLVRDNYGSTALVRATAGERIGVEHCSDGTMHVYVNGEDQGVAARNLPRAMLAVFDLFGAIESVSLCSSAFVPSRHTPNCYEVPAPITGSLPSRFYEALVGKNIQLASDGIVAKRIASFNDAIVLSAQPLVVGQTFTVRISRLSVTKWESSLCIGILGELPSTLPSSALEFTKLSWFIVGKSVYVNGRKVKHNYGPNLDLLKEQSAVGVMVDSSRQLHLLVNGIDQGVACGKVFAARCFAVCDLYGRCEKVEVLQEDESDEADQLENAIEAPEKAHLDDNHGRKENSQEPRPTQVDKMRVVLASCPHHQAALYLLRYVLCLPWHLVDGQQCSCEGCLLRGTVREKIMKKCSVFTFKTSAKSSPSWDTAFSLDIPLGALRKCIDHGRLLARQEWGVAPVVAPASAKHLDSKTSAPIVRATPSLRYALSRAPTYRFTPRGSSDAREARVVLQALICPDSYQKILLPDGVSVPGAVVSNSGASSPLVQQEKWEEWHTKEKSASAVQAIVVSFD